jgi:hypothetical protein
MFPAMTKKIIQLIATTKAGVNVENKRIESKATTKQTGT